MHIPWFTRGMYTFPEKTRVYSYIYPEIFEWFLYTYPEKLRLHYKNTLSQISIHILWKFQGRCNIYSYISHIYTHTLKISGYMCKIYCYISHNLIAICRFQRSYLDCHTKILPEPRFADQLLALWRRQHPAEARFLWVCICFWFGSVSTSPDAVELSTVEV